MSYPFDPFAEIAQLQRVECRNGISYFDLATTAHNVWFRSQGSMSAGYELKDADRPPWESISGKAASIIDLPESEQAEVQISAKALAKALYNQYNIECDKNPDWENASQNEKIAWEAVGRHLANIIDSDGQTPNFPELEERIVAWALERSQPAQLVL